MKIEKDLYAYFRQSAYENNCNTYVIGGERTVLIDPGHLAHIEKLFRQMEEDGISPDRVDLVILTHSHPDHSEGLEALFHRPVKVAMHREEEQYINHYLEFFLNVVQK